jgi:hypothetical protein
MIMYIVLSPHSYPFDIVSVKTYNLIIIVEEVGARWEVFPNEDRTFAEVTL